MSCFCLIQRREPFHVSRQAETVAARFEVESAASPEPAHGECLNGLGFNPPLTTPPFLSWENLCSLARASALSNKILADCCLKKEDGNKAL